MFGTPIRWLLMVGVAACGCFMIASASQEERAMAFVVSALLWQAHYVVLLWEADGLRKMGATAAKQRAHAPLPNWAFPPPGAKAAEQQAAAPLTPSGAAMGEQPLQIAPCPPFGRLASEGIRAVELDGGGRIIRTLRRMPLPDEIRRTGWFVVAMGGERQPMREAGGEVSRR